MMRALALFVFLSMSVATVGGVAIGVEAQRDTCITEYVPHVGEACLRTDGLYEVTLPDGFVMTTHGPDPAPPPGDVGFELDAEQRPPVCATEWKMHVLYGHPSSGGRASVVLPQIRDAVYRMNALLNADAMESGDVNADYRVLCEGGEMSIDTFVGPQTGGSGAYTIDFSNVVAAAREAGFTEEDTDYLIFYDGNSDGVCGVGNLARDDSLSEDNANMIGPDYGVAYESCWFGRTPMHENGHTQGAVQDLAPDNDLSGHCLEGIDVMCYPTSSILVLCSDRVHFDCDHDTYFDAEPEDGEWLATHWNLGSRLNRYIHFGDQELDPGPPTTTPPDDGAESNNGTGTDPGSNSTHETDGNQTSSDGDGNQTVQNDAGEDGGGDEGAAPDQQAPNGSEGLPIPTPSVFVATAAVLVLAAILHRRRPPQT